MRNLSDRIAKLEMAGPGSRRVMRHVLRCAPCDRAARVAAIEKANPEAFHIIRTIVDPSETKAELAQAK